MYWFFFFSLLSKLESLDLICLCMCVLELKVSAQYLLLVYVIAHVKGVRPQMVSRVTQSWRTLAADRKDTPLSCNIRICGHLPRHV